MRFEITDLPGTLGCIAGLIGEAGANIIDVTHHRLFLDVPAKAADLDFTIETRDADLERIPSETPERPIPRERSHLDEP